MLYPPDNYQDELRDHVAGRSACPPYSPKGEGEGSYATNDFSFILRGKYTNVLFSIKFIVFIICSLYSTSFFKINRIRKSHYNYSNRLIIIIVLCNS